jgi:hypothetical protein
MFKIDATPTFMALVRVNTAAIKGEFNVCFVALPTDELAELDDGAADAWRKVLARVVASFDACELAGEQLAGAQADLPRLIRWPGVGAAMLRAYYQGLWEAASGN